MSESKSTDFWRIALLGLLAFMLLFGYANARPAIDSLFLKHHSSAELPYVWLLTALVSAFVIAIYNRYNTRYTLLSLFGWSCLFSSASLGILLVCYHSDIPNMGYLLYVWKDVYIILLLEIFWSFANVVFNLQKARWIYGLLLATGAVGGVLGNLAIGPLAQLFGSASAIWVVLPQLIICWFIAVLVGNNLADEPPEPMLQKENHFGHSLEVVKKSRYLVPLLLVVAVVQITITLIDFEFNSALQRVYEDVDVRTEVMGQVYAAIDFTSLILQFLAGPILRLCGIGVTLGGVPVALGFFILGFIIVPQFVMMIAVKIASKSLDYSIFRVAKEMLYIPLTRSEKTQGKALIDILTYRVAKGFSSILLLGFVATQITSFTLPFALLLIAVWLFLTMIIVRRFRRVVPLQEELKPAR